MTLGEYFANLRDHIPTSLSSALATGDRFFMSDENTAGDPMRYVSLNTLRNYFLDFDARFFTEEATLADTDKIFFHDASADAMRYIEKSDLESELGGGGTTYSAGTGISISGSAISIANDGVTGTQIANDAINSEHITDNSVDLAHLASGTAGAYLGYNSSGNPAELAAPVVDLYEDFPTEISTTLVNQDRMVIADVNATGQPNRHVRLDDLGEYFADLRNHLTSSLSPIAINDRLFMSDESLTGDPMGYITASQLSDFILDLDANFATEETSVADVDKFFFHDVSADAMRYITKADLATELGGESSYVGPPSRFGG